MRNTHDESGFQVSAKDEKPPTLNQGDRMLNVMRLDIITGRLSPNERVKIHELTKRYDVSQTTAREVLPKLAAEGLLVGVAMKGYQVVEATLKDFDELTSLRMDLEVPALRQSIEHGGSDWELGVLSAQHLLKKYVNGFAKTERVEQTNGWIDIHTEFHAALIAGCPSKRRLDFCRNLFNQSSRYYWLASNFLPSSADNLKEHIELADASLTGDIKKAETLLGHHIEKAREDVVLSFEQANA